MSMESFDRSSTTIQTRNKHKLVPQRYYVASESEARVGLDRANMLTLAVSILSNSSGFGVRLKPMKRSAHLQ